MRMKRDTAGSEDEMVATSAEAVASAAVITTMTMV